MNAKLGIVDWGIGGISIHQLIKHRLGDIPIIYLSDTGVTPYGKMSRPRLIKRLAAVTAFMKARGVTHLVFACNAASTALSFLDSDGIVVEGIIESAVRAAASLCPPNLGLIGGGRTVRSGVYRRAFNEHGIRVKQRIAQPLSGLIENGDTTSTALDNHCRAILGPLKNCSHVLLACTHYPAIGEMLQRHVSAQTVLIDPAAELVKRIKRWRLQSGGADVFLTTGDTRKVKLAAQKAFGCEIERVRKVRL